MRAIAPVLQIFGRPLVLVSVSLTPWISPRKHSTTMPPILVPADRWGCSTLNCVWLLKACDRCEDNQPWPICDRQAIDANDEACDTGGSDARKNHALQKNCSPMPFFQMPIDWPSSDRVDQHPQRAPQRKFMWRTSASKSKSRSGLRIKGYRVDILDVTTS
jgi:hypothetical protein